MSEINITIFHPPTSRTDAISLPLTATFSDLSSFASALLDLDGDIVILRDRIKLSDENNAQQTLQSGGIKDGDLLTILRVSEVPSGSPARQRPRPNPTGGLDFSNLLASSTANSAPSNNAGLTFNIPGLAGPTITQPTEWNGMSLDDAIERNPNVIHLMTLFTSPRHPNLLKELNYHMLYHLLLFVC
jgi:hypothetical protein